MAVRGPTLDLANGEHPGEVMEGAVVGQRLHLFERRVSKRCPVLIARRDSACHGVWVITQFPDREVWLAQDFNHQMTIALGNGALWLSEFFLATPVNSSLPRRKRISSARIT